ncbi:ARM repeat-containing protein [Meredithblackwellia eburnea MCA 4105]
MQQSHAEKAIASLKSNSARLASRLQENLAEHSRDIALLDTFSATGSSAAKYLDSGVPPPIEETKKLLSSRRESERIDGLKRVVAMMLKPHPVSVFFPLVTSLLTPTTSLPTRSLISLYILHVAHTDPSLALLAINAYQKDLSDPSPFVRAGAIKTLARMNLPDIRPLVNVSVDKAARDGSWYVRRAACDAVRTMWSADPDPEHRPQLEKTIDVLLKGAGPLTVGAALAAWEEVCPQQWDLIHPNYRAWCGILGDMEEWGQCTVLRVLGRYVRLFCRDPAEAGLDKDQELLLDSSEMLLGSLNEAVVVAAAKLHFYLGTPTHLAKIAKPLIRILHTSTSPEVRASILENCLIVAERHPELLSPHIVTFYIKASTPLLTKRTQLKILVALTTTSNVRPLLKEYLVYVKDTDEEFSNDAIAAIGTCAKRVPAVADECVSTLLQLVKGKHDSVLAQAIVVLRTLLTSPSSASSRAPIASTLVQLLDTGRIRSPTAKSNIYWLLGQYCDQGKILEQCVPDAVRVGARNFAEEADETKLQLLTMSAKALVVSHLSTMTPHLRHLSLLFNYLTTLARYDLAYQVRDRARFLAGLLQSAGIGSTPGGDTARLGMDEEDFKSGVEVEVALKKSGEEDDQLLRAEQVRRILFDGKAEATVIADRSTDEELGTFLIALGTNAPRLSFTDPLPPYATSIPPSSIRDAISSSGTPSKLPQEIRSASSRPMTGFGNTTPPVGGSGRASPIVLVPTNLASADSSRSASPFVTGGGRGRGGFVDLEDFYADGSSEEDGEDGESDESEVEGEEGEETGEEDGEEEDEDSEEDESDDGSEEDESGTVRAS